MSIDDDIEEKLKYTYLVMQKMGTAQDSIVGESNTKRGVLEIIRDRLPKGNMYYIQKIFFGEQ